MSSFEWHLMADEAPEIGGGSWLLICESGTMYVANEFMDVLGQWRGFFIPNGSTNFLYVESVRAWAEIPPLEVDA